MLQQHEIPKGADDALVAGYKVVSATSGEEARMLAAAARQATQGPDNPNRVEALLGLVRELPGGVGEAQLIAVLETLATSVPELSGLEQAVLQSGLHRALEEKGIRKSSGLVAAVLKKTPAQAENESDTRLSFESVDPHPDAVDGPSVADEVERVLRKYLVMPDGAVEAITLWIIHTFLVSALYLTPRLALLSPVMRCGKTTVLRLLNALTEKPLLAYNPTPATLFRVMQKHRPTIILDEADTWIKESEEIRGIVNGGFEREGGALRCSGDDHDVHRFQAYGAMAIAAIGSLPNTINDRSIVIKMRRKRKDEAVSKLRIDRIGLETDDIRKKIARWASDNIAGIAQADPVVPYHLGLNDRAEDCWRPLLAIADELGGDWPDKARNAAIALNIGKDSDDDDVGILLLSDIRDVFGRLDVDRIHSKPLAHKLKGLADRPWGEFGKSNQGLSPNIMGRLLQPFGIAPKSIRITDHRGNSESKKGYHLGQFEEAWSRYLTNSPASGAKQNPTTSQHSNDKGPTSVSKGHNSSSVTFPNEPPSASSSHCDVVGFWNGDPPRPAQERTNPSPQHNGATDKKGPQHELGEKEASGTKRRVI